MRPRGLAESGVVLLAGLVLTAALTYPLLFKLDHVGRTNSSDGLWSLWVVSWVAHALTTDPRALYDANIFYPHAGTLAFSEANLGAGIIGVPFWLASHNPFLTHNAVVIIGFLVSFAGAYYLTRYLTANRGAAAIVGMMFAFCPFVFARTAHIQLLLIGGLPFAMLAFHRVVDKPTVGRTIALGVILWAQALSCAYYGIFAGLMVAFGTLMFAWTRGLWRSRDYWVAIGLAAFVSIALTLPFFMPYVWVQQTLGFSRTLLDAGMFSADAGAWLASSAWAHRWWLPAITPYNEVLFPGIVATILGLTGVWIGLRPRTAPVTSLTPTSPVVARDVAAFYVAIGLIAFWASFGPDAWLYTVLYKTIPVFSFLRAPARMGIITTLSLAVLAGIALSAWPRISRRLVPVMLLLLLVGADLISAPLGMLRDAEPVDTAYRVLATLPPGAVAEFPYFYDRPSWPRHSYYMLKSTYHWHPLVNGYSDHIPSSFRDNVIALSSFPTRQSFGILRDAGARYVVFHMSSYDRRTHALLLERLKSYEAYLRPIVRDDEVWLFEIVGSPNFD